VTSSLPTVLSVFGTRPEAIKMAPVVRALAAHPKAVRSQVCVTAQHRQILDQVLGLFEIRPDHDLDLMRPGQDLSALTAAVLTGVRATIAEVRPQLVIVQGDTTTTFAASLAAFYEGVPVAHVEAGLRSGNLLAPWPEELNRRLTSAMATLHFAATEGNRQNLLREGVPADRIHVTGNPIVDALALMTARLDGASLDLQFSFLDPARRLILVTAHRRESFGVGMENICAAIREIVCRHPDAQVVYPVHPNPQVREPVERILGKVGARQHGLHLIEPLEYLPFVQLLRRADLLITDSGGIQEEATVLGKPVLVMREATERPEAIAAGVACLVGTDVGRILSETDRVLSERGRGPGDADVKSTVFGDGKAGERIAAAIIRELGR
jgi:UDP-N-acetylglucosamine 2-epimerase (non-hydrolysing)